MRVVHLSWEYPNLHLVGGLGRHVYYLTKHLADLGAEVHVITLSIGERRTFREDGVYVHPVNMFALRSTRFITWCLNFNYLMMLKAYEIVREFGRPDIIHAHDWLTAYAGICLKHALKVPLIATIHATEHGRRGGIWTSEQREIHEWEWRLTYEAWKVVVCSKFMLDEVRRVFGLPMDKIVVIPNGIDVKDVERRAERASGGRPRCTSSHDEKVILFVGRLVYEKGPDLLVEAMRILLNERGICDVRLVIVGDGPMREYLADLVRRYGIEHKVCFTGRVSDDTLYQLIRSAYVCVFPSRYEPFGIVALEAMALSVPVIVSRSGGFSEVVEDRVNGLNVSLDPRDIADKIAYLLDSKDVRDRMAREARRTAERHYRWSTMARFTMHIYEQVLDELRRSGWINYFVC